MESVLKRFGKLDVVLHTVGGFAGGKSVAETDDAMFQGIFDINLNTTFYLLRAVLPAMRKARGGRIVAIGSRAALEPRRRSGSLRCFKGGHGFADEDRGSGK